MQKHPLTLFAIMLLPALALAACGGNAPPEATSPAAEVFLTGEAQVENIEPRVLETMPLKAEVLVYGTLPDSCTQFGQVDQRVVGDLILIEIETARSVDESCEPGQQDFQETFALNVTDLSAGNYTVEVNGVTAPLLIPEHRPVSEEALAACPEKEPGLKVFINSRDGYCFLHPERYTPQEAARNTVVLSGPQFEEGIEPVTVSLTIERLGPADGKTTEEIAVQRLQNFSIEDSASRQGWVSLGGEQALSVDGVPGRYFSRRTFVVYDGTAYEMTLSPADLTIPAPSDEAGLLWNEVVRTFTFFVGREPAGDRPVDCEVDAEFVEDVTIPDGTPVVPGRPVVKTWRMRNTGTCTWGSNYTFEQTDADGNLLVADPAAISVPETPPDETVDLSVSVVLSAESPIGTQQSASFRMKAPDGRAFGTEVYVLVQTATNTNGE